jgi:hypothetical protein
MTRLPRWEEMRIRDAMNTHIAVARTAINASSSPVNLHLPPAYFPQMLLYFLPRRFIKRIEITGVHDDVVIRF